MEKELDIQSLWAHDEAAMQEIYQNGADQSYL